MERGETVTSARRAFGSLRLSRFRRAIPLAFVLSSVLGAAPAAAQELEPASITCPQVEGYEATFRYEESVALSTNNGGYRVNCWYQSLNQDDNGVTIDSELILDAYWATPEGDEYVAVWYPPGADNASRTLAGLRFRRTEHGST